MSSPILDLLFLAGAFALVALATLGLGFFARTVRNRFTAGSSPRRGAPVMGTDDVAVAAWEDEGGSHARR
jgi:hypothetical protein